MELEVTLYNDENKVAGRVTDKQGKRPVFQVLEADIPEPVLEWVRGVLSKMGG